MLTDLTASVLSHHRVSVSLWSSPDNYCIPITKFVSTLRDFSLASLLSRILFLKNLYLVKSYQLNINPEKSKHSIVFVVSMVFPAGKSFLKFVVVVFAAVVLVYGRKVISMAFSVMFSTTFKCLEYILSYG